MLVVFSTVWRMLSVLMVKKSCFLCRAVSSSMIFFSAMSGITWSSALTVIELMNLAPVMRRMTVV